MHTAGIEHGPSHTPVRDNSSELNRSYIEYGNCPTVHKWCNSRYKFFFAVKCSGNRPGLMSHYTQTKAYDNN